MNYAAITIAVIVVIVAIITFIIILVVLSRRLNSPTIITPTDTTQLSSTTNPSVPTPQVPPAAPPIVQPPFVGPQPRPPISPPQPQIIVQPPYVAPPPTRPPPPPIVAQPPTPPTVQQPIQSAVSYGVPLRIINTQYNLLVNICRSGGNPLSSYTNLGSLNDTWTLLTPNGGGTGAVGTGAVGTGAVGTGAVGTGSPLRIGDRVIIRSSTNGFNQTNIVATDIMDPSNPNCGYIALARVATPGGYENIWTVMSPDGLGVGQPVIIGTTRIMFISSRGRLSTCGRDLRTGCTNALVVETSAQPTAAANFILQ